MISLDPTLDIEKLSCGEGAHLSSCYCDDQNQNSTYLDVLVVYILLFIAFQKLEIR